MMLQPNYINILTLDFYRHSSTYNRGRFCMIRKQICVKIKFKVVSRKAPFFVLNTGIISWAKVPGSHQKQNKHGKTKSEYVTLSSTFVELVTIPTKWSSEH